MKTKESNFFENQAFLKQNLNKKEYIFLRYVFK